MNHPMEVDNIYGNLSMDHPGAVYVFFTTLLLVEVGFYLTKMTQSANALKPRSR